MICNENDLETLKFLENQMKNIIVSKNNPNICLIVNKIQSNLKYTSNNLENKEFYSILSAFSEKYGLKINFANLVDYSSPDFIETGYNNKLQFHNIIIKNFFNKCLISKVNNSAKKDEKLKKMLTPEKILESLQRSSSKSKKLTQIFEKIDSKNSNFVDDKLDVNNTKLVGQSVTTKKELSSSKDNITLSPTKIQYNIVIDNKNETENISKNDTSLPFKVNKDDNCVIF